MMPTNADLCLHFAAAGRDLCGSLADICHPQLHQGGSRVQEFPTQVTQGCPAATNQGVYICDIMKHF